MHQPTLISDETITLRVVRDGKVGCAVTNRTDDDGLREMARRAAEAADSAPPDPGYAGLQPAASVPDVAGFDGDTAALTPEEQAGLAAQSIEAVPEFGLYGYFTSGTTETAVASSSGHAVSQRMTDASVLAIAASDDASGYAEATSWKAGDLDPAACAREAAEKAGRTIGATEIEAGTHAAILEPYAFSELLWYFGFSSLEPFRASKAAAISVGAWARSSSTKASPSSTTGSTPRGCPRPSTWRACPSNA